VPGGREGGRSPVAGGDFGTARPARFGRQYASLPARPADIAFVQPARVGSPVSPDVTIGRRTMMAANPTDPAPPSDAGAERAMNPVMMLWLASFLLVMIFGVATYLLSWYFERG